MERRPNRHRSRRRLPARNSELLGLMKGADSVELKLTVPETDQRPAMRSLELDMLDGQIRQVVFFDTPDLELYRNGVVVRARRVQGKGDDSVVKLRPVAPAELPAKLRKSLNFGVEVDAMPGGFVCSGSLKAQWGPAAVKGVIMGERPIRKLFTNEQRDFYAAHAPKGRTLDDLVPLGPLNVLKLRFVPKGFPHEDGGRNLVLPERDAHPRTLHQVPAERGIPGRGRDEGLPLRPWRGDVRDPADQDAHGAGAFLEGPASRGSMTDAAATRNGPAAGC